jgi:hypothetical protein
MMMTVDDLRERPRTMDPQAKEEFRKSIGAPNFDDGRIVEMFRDGGWYARICDYFKVPTESSLVAQATFDAAFYAKLAFYAAIASIIISAIALFRS